MNIYFCDHLHVASFKKFDKEPIDGKIQWSKYYNGEQGVALTGRNTTGRPCNVTVEL